MMNKKALFSLVLISAIVAVVVVVVLKFSKELNISNQSGAGASIGLGTEFSFSENFSIQINPYLNFHGLIMINREDYPERILDAGAKLCFLINR